LGDDRNAFLGEELLHNKRCVARCVIVMQKPHGKKLRTNKSHLQIVGQNRMNGSVRDAIVPTPRWSFFDHIESVVALFQSEEFRGLFDCPTY